MAKFSFNDVFIDNPDNTLTPRRSIRIGAATFGSGITFGPGVAFGGINIFDFKGCDIEADDEADILVIKGFYK
ncbi:hypothetical protein HYW17_00105 [Candidatus Uhrbacteria bacterium]|nr:hypothetical protein [Candidatus Uhrbacteria bacterium]